MARRSWKNIAVVLSPLTVPAFALPLYEYKTNTKVSKDARLGAWILFGFISFIIYNETRPY